MKIWTESVYSNVKTQDMLGKTTIMVDALRASATIITAITNGCDRIVPTSEANEAAAIKKISEGNLLLCGEIAGQKVGGFDLGNSPLEYTQDIVEDKILIFSTTNGTSAIKALAAAESVLIATFINAAAAAQMACDMGNDVLIVGAGTNGRVSLDDVIATGCVIDRFLKIDESIETDDAGKIALKLYKDAQEDVLGSLAGSEHFEYLKQLKFYDDLEYCTREDMFDVVPVYREGVIIKG